MSAPFVIPFNFCPISTSIKTTSYTIPTGKYAKVNQIRTSLYVNGVLLNEIASGTISASTTLGTYNKKFNPLCKKESGIYFTDISFTRAATGGSGVNTGTIVEYVKILSTTDEINTLLSLSSTSNGTITSGNFWQGSDSFYSTTSIGAGAGSSTMAFNYTFGVASEFWVPSGTVLNGLKYQVTEYNQIS